MNICWYSWEQCFSLSLFRSIDFLFNPNATLHHFLLLHLTLPTLHTPPLSLHVAPKQTATPATSCAAGLGLSAGLCTSCGAGQFSANNDANACTTHSITSCPVNQGFAAGSNVADSSCAACAEGSFSNVNDASPCALAELDAETVETIAILEGAVANTSIVAVLGALANLSTTLGAGGANGGVAVAEAGKRKQVRTVMVTAIGSTANFANLSDSRVLGALTQGLTNATQAPKDVTTGTAKTSVEIVARFAVQLEAVASSAPIQQNLISVLSNSLEAGAAWTKPMKTTSEKLSVPTVPPTASAATAAISKLVTDAIGNISQAQLRGASAATPPVVMTSPSIGVVSKKVALVTEQQQGKAVLTIDLAAVSSADYAPLNSAARSDAKVLIREAPVLSAGAFGSGSNPTFDIQVTQWSADSNPFSFDDKSFDDGAGLAKDDVPGPSDLITFTLRYNGGDLPESMRVLAQPVVFSFPITINPNITLSPSTSLATACTATITNAKRDPAPVRLSYGRDRSPPPSAPPSSLYVRASVEVNKTDLVDCAHWDVAKQRWSRNPTRGGHCKLKSFNCTTGRAECECKHLTDFGALLKYNFAKLEKALTAPSVDPKSVLLGLLVVLAPLFIFALVLLKSAVSCMIRGGRTKSEGKVEGATGSNSGAKVAPLSAKENREESRLATTADEGAPTLATRGRAGTQTQLVATGKVGVALGVSKLRKNRTDGENKHATCSLYWRAFVDNHEMVMVFFAPESTWDNHVHRGTILITYL